MSKQNTPNVATRPPSNETSLAQVEELAKKYALSACEARGCFERALVLSEGIMALRQAVKPLLPRILPLMNSQLGFLTDRKGKEPYPDEVVLECLIEATLRGLYPVGNEWNILAGRAYITKEGYARLVRELPGLTDLKLEPGVPKMLAGGAVVPYRAAWKQSGKGYQLVREIPVRLNAGMGVDGAIGKATRKMLAAIHTRVTGSFLTEGDAEGDDLPHLPAKTVRENGQPSLVTKEQEAQLSKLSQHLQLSSEEFFELVEQFGGKSDEEALLLTQQQAQELILHLEDLAAAEKQEREAIESQA